MQSAILTYTYRASSVPIFPSLETTPVKFSTNCDVVDPWNRLDSDVSCQASASVSLETASVEFSTKCDVVDPWNRLDSDVSCRFSASVLLESTSEEFSTECNMVDPCSRLDSDVYVSCQFSANLSFIGNYTGKVQYKLRCG